MMRHSVRRRMTATPEQLMAAILDNNHWPRWRPGLETVTHVSDAPIMLATAWNEHRRLAGRNLSFLARAVEVDPPRAFAYTASGDGFDVSFRWDVRPDSERTLVTQDVAVRTVGLRNFLSSAAKSFLDQQNAALDELRTLIHSLRIAT